MEVITVILQLIGGIGIATGIVFGLATWLGKVWAARILAADQAKYAQALHEATAKYDQQLEIAKSSITRYGELQFTKYGDLWQSLCDLRSAGDDLWESASPEKVKKFAKQVRDTRLSVQKSALILTEDHYAGLLSAMDSFDEFMVGKTTLVRLRSHPMELENDEIMIRDAVNRNGQIRASYSQKLEDLRVHLKRQIGGSQ